MKVSPIVTSRRTNLALSVQNVGVRLQKRYGFLRLQKKSHWALRDVNFEVMRGQVLGVIGRNGSGKSTLLRTLAGIIRPDSGQIQTFGNSVTLLALAAGFVGELTGRQNSMLSGMLMGRTRSEMLELEERIKEFSEIGDWFDVPVSTYSSGMRQRLAFSTALYVRADVLLLDEILSVGDESFRAKSKQAMQDLIESDRTVVLVSNNTQAIENLCDSALWIESGRVTFQGDSGLVREAYRRFCKEVRGRAWEALPSGFIKGLIEETIADHAPKSSGTDLKASTN